MKARLAQLIDLAAELQATGAIRPEFQSHWGNFRVSLDQAHDAAETPAPAAPVTEQLAGLAADLAAVKTGVQALRDGAGL